MSDIDIIKDLVIKESGIDISEKTRRREVVEVRGLFFHVTKTLKPLSTFNSMGKSVGVNHATVIHSMGMFDTYSKYNKELNRLKESILNRYIIEHKFYHLHTIDDEIVLLEKRLAELKEYRESLN
jgi:chromosomal replication initiation ATPase DnaA